MKTSKIKSINKKVVEYNNPRGGIIYYRDIEFENGDKGSIGTKEESPDWMTEGRELTYSINGNKIKREMSKDLSAPKARRAPVQNSDIFPVKKEKMLFFDIESCGSVYEMGDLSPELHKLYLDRIDWWNKRFPEFEDNIGAMFINRSALVAEFSKILVMSFGWYSTDGMLVTKSTQNIEDAVILMNRFYDNGYYLCGQNVKSFDIPLLSKKCLEHKIRPPKYAPKYDDKPWEMKVIDTKSYYQFGNSFSLSGVDSIAAITGIESPKDGEVNGKNMHEYWYKGEKSQEEKLEQISKYCENDIIFLASFIDFIENLK